MPATGETTGRPSAATMSWPWWMWPVRPAPKRAPSLPKEYGPWTGKTFEPVVASDAGAAGAAGAGGGVGATTLKRRAQVARDAGAADDEPRRVLADGHASPSRCPRTSRVAPTRPSRTRTAGWPGAITSTRTSAPGVARKAKVTLAPGATVAGLAVKPRAVGPASVPPLPRGGEAVAGKTSRARKTVKARITPLMSAARELL